MPLAAHDKLGPYEILDQLGKGGMGIVYRARDGRLDRHVAIKVLPPNLAADPEARERLRREAMAAAALDHPYICKIYEIGEDKGEVYLAMEFIAGDTLHQRLHAGGMLLPEILRIAIETAEALEEAHERRILHRDLKPDNLMLTTQGHVKVMDFGLARRMEEPLLDDGSTRGVGTHLTIPGAILGTPDYMSPEQVKGIELDPRSDQFSFGVILAEMLSGSHPFRKGSTVETLAAVIKEAPQISGDIPQPLMVIVRRMLAKVPDERFASMATVRAELQRLTAQAAVAGPSSGPERIPAIGREAELKQLLQLLDEALAGRGSLVLLGGEPGIGKTHLISALADAARLRGALVVTGHCYETDGSPPYNPFIEMVEWSIRNGSRDNLRHALGEDAPAVARLVPELRQIFQDIPPAPELPPDQQRRFLFNAYRAFVERVSHLTPVVAVFEDLQWADEPTVLLLEHLAKTVSSIPRLMIVTYRDVDLEASRPFARTLESLLRQKLATRILLRRLPVGAVEQMIAALSAQTPPKSFARVVFEETEGNPFFVEEVFRHLAEEGKIFDDKGVFLADLRVDQLEVPEGVRLVLNRRLEHLSDESRRILTTAAVIGRVVPLELLEELEHARPDAALDAVEEAERAHLVEAETSGRQTRYRFVHELVRQTLAEALSMPRRQRLHARIADGIEKLYASSIESHVSTLAHHLFQAGGSVETGRAVRYLTLAAAFATNAAAYEDALQHIENALSLLEDQQSLPVAELEELRGRALLSLGRNGEAVLSLERAIASFEALGDHLRFIDASFFLYGYYAFSLQLDKVDQLAARVGSAAASGPPWLPCAILGIQAGAEGLHGRIDAALALLDQMQAVPEDSLPPLIQRMAFQVDRSVRLTSGQFALCESSAWKVAALLDPQTDLWYLAANDYGLFLPPSFDGRVSEAKRRAEEAVARAERVGHHAARLSALSQLAMLHVALGQMEAAEQVARESVAFGEENARGLLFVGEMSLGLVLTYRLGSGEALPLLGKSSSCPGYFAGAPESLHAISLAAAGKDPSAAAAAAAAHLTKTGVSRSYGSMCATVNLAEAWAIAGRAAEAAFLLPFAERVAAEWVTNPAGFPARTAAGIAAAGAGDWARAEEHHRASLAQMDSGEYVSGRVYARVWYADMLLARHQPGDHAAARDLLNEAIVQAEPRGLALYARLARERVAKT